MATAAITGTKVRSVEFLKTIDIVEELRTHVGDKLLSIDCAVLKLLQEWRKNTVTLAF